ncbi:hypothetical protein GCM10017607_00020 [Microbacterium thalassium]|nr:hypothetical protein GCM10017607_00020 [Microbacterium thalassium]
MSQITVTATAFHTARDRDERRPTGKGGAAGAVRGAGAAMRGEVRVAMSLMLERAF